MVDPLLALALFAVAVAVAAIIAWPRHGLWARSRRLRRASARVQVEDTLKYLFHRSASSPAVHADAVAGALAVGRGTARRILEGLVASGLAVARGDGFALTATGRTEALRIVRSHRLLESYFADRTGVAPAEWHELAEEGEHELSAQEVETLAARLGQPRFDPHGDPIPTATGELPAATGAPLSDLEDGVRGTVVHLEDEPREDYERLIALGLSLGQQVVRRGRSSDGLALEIEGRPLALPFDLADAITVERSDAEASGPVHTLADLSRGEMAVVRRLSRECRGAQRRRLLDLGVVPGTPITAEMRSASGDPTAYRIRGALIALRRHQAEWIEVEPAEATHPGSGEAA